VTEKQTSVTNDGRYHYNTTLSRINTKLFIIKRSKS